MTFWGDPLWGGLSVCIADVRFWQTPISVLHISLLIQSGHREVEKTRGGTGLGLSPTISRLYAALSICR
jgi:hypothetical protein